MFPSTCGEENICVSSCTYRETLSPTDSKLSSSWEMFIHKQKKKCFKQSVLDEVTVSQGVICENFIWERVEARWWCDFTEVYGENIGTKVLLCVFSLLERASSIPGLLGRRLNCSRAQRGQRVRFGWTSCWTTTRLCFSQEGLDQMC